MTWRLAGGLLLALASTGAINWGFFVQQRTSSELPPLRLRAPLRSLLLLARSPGWRLGFLTGIGGWGLYVAALALAPLSLVQACSAGGFGLLALLVRRREETVFRRLEWTAVGTAILGLALLGASLRAGRQETSSGAADVVFLWLAASLAAAAVTAGSLAPRLVPGAGLGLAAGVLYGAGDVATKAALAGGTRVAFVAALLLFSGLAFASLQLGFQRGNALVTAGPAVLLTNSLPIAAGIAVFGEPLPGGAYGALRLLAFAATVLGAALIAGGARASPQASGPGGSSYPES